MSEQGPFEHRREGRGGGRPRDEGARKILIGMGVVGVILLILILPPISLLSGGNSGGPAVPPGVTGSEIATQSGSNALVPKAPDGFEVLSVLNTNLSDKGLQGPFVLTVKLLQPVTDGRNLGLYTYKDNQWTRIAAGTLSENGVEVKAQVATIPDNVAVLRRTTSAAEVSGWLPAGAQPDANALSVLTTINPLGVTPAADGSLAGTQTDVPDVQGNVIPTVRATSPEEIDAVNTILTSPNLQDAHVQALVQLALQPGNAGVDLDYRNVAPARKADFTQFVTSLAQQLHQSDRSLTLTLPMPVQTGVSWDTGAYDWAALSGVADSLNLAAELDPSAYYDKMDAVLGYLKQSVDLRKVHLIVTRKSIEKASDGSLSFLTLHDALSRATDIEVRTTTPIVANSSVVIVGKNIFTDDGASGLLWDQNADAVSFSYPGTGGQRTVWIQNRLSLAFQLDLAQRYGLGGIAIDDVSQNDAAPDVWNLVASYGETGSVDLVAPNSVMLKPTWKVQAGSAEPGSKGNLVWKAPAQAGSYEIQLIVSDGVIWAEQKINLDVTPQSSADSSNEPTPTTTASR